ncbi:MAG: PKD domain-containing protein [Ferruginibacter sp.]|nr:PKD domain-containing protein [Ferruginibacter sp.]
MKRNISFVCIFFVLIVLSSKKLSAQIEFVENKGQWDGAVLYKGNFKTGSFYIEKNSFSALIHNADEFKQIAQLMHGNHDSPLQMDKKVILHSFHYRVSFLGASDKIASAPEKPIQSINNYFIGNDPSRWASNCRLFQSVTCKDVYPNIDIRYYTEGEKLKYDFIVHPGGNASQIAMRYDGPSSIYVKKKELIIKTTVGDIKELYPYSYQPSSEGNQREEVACKYVVRDNVVTFDLKKYDPTKILVIDPSIIFSSFTGSAADNWGYTATPGPDGSLFAGGVCFGEGFLTSPGSYQSVYSGGVVEGALQGHDIAIFKFSPDGTRREYATYLGGNGNEQPHSMIADANGNLIIAGRSFSGNYPTTIPLIGSGGNNDIVITKLNATGTGIIGSVRIGGSNDDGVNIRSKYEPPDGADRLRRNYGDDARSEVILDDANNIILASCTQSSNFPVRGASLNALGLYGGGFQDGLILKFNSNLSSYIYGSYFGGSGDDACFVTSINPLTKNIFIAGATTSNDLPGNKFSVISPSNNGGETEGFITQVRLDGTGILKTSYLGTSGTDIVYGLKFDKNGFPYVMGTTTGSWPVINATYSISRSSQFIAKLNPDFSSFVYSTVFGNGTAAPNLSPIGFLVDRCENVYVSGWGGGINVFKNYTTGTTNGLPLKNPLSGISAPDGEDLYFFVLKKNASELLFASNFGQFQGSVGDHVDGGTSRFDENGVIYQAICANCNGGAVFPTTPNAWRRLNGSSNCNEAAVKIEMSFSGVVAGFRATINNVPYDTTGCTPLTVNFNDTLQKGKTFYWDFGNGQKDTTYAPDFATSATYNTAGTYTVRMIAEDSMTCNIRDTAYLKIIASNNKADLNFTAVKDLPCTSLNYSFVNNSVAVNAAFGPKSFVWDYGDGSPPDTAFNGSHIFPALGTYTVKLTLIDLKFCNAPETKSIQVKVDPLVKAKFSTPTAGCAPYTANFINQSGTSDVTWLFDDGTRTNTENPSKTYSIPGTYRVRLIARDPNTCNKADTSEFVTIVVSGKPRAEFTWQPNPPISNTPTNFTNLSTGAVKYEWDFGDGTSSSATDPSHQYTATGTFSVRLVAINQFNCTDTFRLTVQTLVSPLLDIPNAFTPGKFGPNSTINIKAFGISRLEWRIYNRWGQLVFQTNDLKIGWDGKFKGKDQPMDVYTYTLEAEFTDGKKVNKTGDISLLR